MVKRNPELVGSLQTLLNQEYQLHEKLLALIELEKAAVTRADVEKVSALNQEREKLSEAAIAAKDRRLEFMARQPAGQELRLTNWIEKHCHPADQKALLPLARKLKTIIGRSQQNGREFNQLLNFALNMVNGTLSILWSATQSIFRSYGQDGAIKESYHPSDSRASTVLKQA